MIYSENITPNGLAAKLATYIADPSTIRVQVLGHFGRAPSIDKIKELQARARAKGRQSKYDEKKFRLECYRHQGPYEMDADGIDRCTTCKAEKREAVKAKPERVKALKAPATLFPSWYKPPVAQPLKPATTLDAVCMVFGLSLAEIKGGARHRQLTEARAVAAQIMHRKGLPYKQIARLMNMHCHSSTRYLILRWDTFCKRNPELPGMLAKVQRKLAA